MDPAAQPAKYVFVCYSRADMKVVDKVLRELEKGGHRMWIDREGIVGSQTWREEIVKALQQCRAVLFFGSRESYRSRHVATELTLAEEAHKPIIPVLLDDAPPEGDVRYFLARLHHLKLCGNDESCAIQVIHDTLVRIDGPTGYVAAPLPKRPERRRARPLVGALAVTLVAVTAWGLRDYIWRPRGETTPAAQAPPHKQPDAAAGGFGQTAKEAENESEKGSNEKGGRDDTLAKDLSTVSKKDPIKQLKQEPKEQPPETPPQITQSNSGDPPVPPPLSLPPTDTDWMVPGADAEVILAIQVGTLTSENGKALQLPVSFDVHDTVRIQKQSGDRIQIGSSLPSVEKGWLKKAAAKEYLKPKP